MTATVEAAEPVVLAQALGGGQVGVGLAGGGVEYNLWLGTAYSMWETTA